MNRETVFKVNYKLFSPQCNETTVWIWGRMWISNGREYLFPAEHLTEAWNFSWYTSRKHSGLHVLHVIQQLLETKVTDEDTPGAAKQTSVSLQLMTSSSKWTRKEVKNSVIWKSIPTTQETPKTEKSFHYSAFKLTWIFNDLGGESYVRFHKAF